MNVSLRCAALGAIVALIAPRPADASCIPGFDYAAFGKSRVEIGGGADTNSYDSSVGNYATTNALTGGNIATNGTNCVVNSVELNGSSTTINGTIQYGAGGSGCVVDAGSATVNGAISALPAPVALPSVVIPPTTTYPTAVTPASATMTLAPNRTYGTFTLGPTHTLTLTTGVYIFDNLDLKGTVIVTPGPVIIYIRNSLAMSGTPNINAVNPQKSTNLIFMVGPLAPTISVRGGANSSFAVYAPDSSVSISGGSDIYGAVIGNVVDATGGANIHYDKALGSFAGGQFGCAATEISRASPVVATITPTSGVPTVSVVQGSFESASGSQTTITTTASVATFSFPYIRGHMRARDATTVTTTDTGFSAGTTLFDAGATGKIPAPNYAGCSTRNGTCRHVFTNTNAASTNGRTFRPTVSVLSDSTASAIGARIAPTAVVPGIGASHWQTIVRKVIVAPLGGVDRSTVAVIQASEIAGMDTRPQIAYFGGADGMLHAVCASIGGRTESSPLTDVCPSLGTEIWSFIPRVQLPLIRTNTARVDGSVRVADVFGDFTNDPATGTKTWRTVMTFQTGFGVGAAPATYAFDITDPAAPVLLWEYTQPTTLGTTEVGTGLTVSMGPVRILGQLSNLAVIQTNNGGSGGVGVVVKALSQETGAVKWTFSYLYPTATTTYRATVDMPFATGGIPGGAVGVDQTQVGTFTDFVFGDLFGNIWRVNATDGVSRNGAGTPLFSFTTNRSPIGAPPAIYSNGSSLFAAVASGGYAHPTAAAWSGTTQRVVAVKLSGTGPTINEATSSCATCALSVNATLATGFKGFAQALVVGSQLLVTSDSQDINLSTYGTTTTATGRLSTYDLTGVAAASTVAIFSGAGSLANNGGTLYASAGTKQTRMSATATTTGESVDLESTKPVIRNLWLRSE